MKSYLKDNIFLISIILIAAILRLFNLSSIPVGFNDDEAAFGYNAYSILKTGRDEWGRFLPFPLFESFGDWKLVVYLYLTVLSQAVFGISEFATRLPSAIFGILAVFATYLLTKQILDRKTAILASLILTISPWHVIASRNAFESDLLIFFITLSTYFFLKGIKEAIFLIPSFSGFLICFYIYRSAWIFLPIFLFSIIYLNWQDIKHVRKYLITLIIISSVLLIPLLPSVLTFRGQSRFIQESFISGVTKTGLINEINENRGNCLSKLPIIPCSIIYNKYYYFSQTFLNNFFDNLSYKTFFEKANQTGFQSFSSTSVFNFFELPLTITGLIALFKIRSQALKILVPWIIFAPLGASFAGVGNYGRINLIMPALQIVAAYGLTFLIKILKVNLLKKTFIFLSIAILAFATVKLYSDMFLIEPIRNSRYQRYGYKQLFNYLKEKENNYDQIIISRKIDYSHQYAQYLYFAKVDPQFYFDNVKRHRGQDGWVILDSIGKYHFVDSLPGVDAVSAKTLFVTAEKETNLTDSLVLAIFDLRGDRLFEIHDLSLIKKDGKQR